MIPQRSSLGYIITVIKPKLDFEPKLRHLLSMYLWRILY